MTPATPFELLQPALPEIIVAISGLAGLALDLTIVQRRTPQTRWKVSGLIGIAGCIAAIFLLDLRPEHATLYDGMLVVNPLTQLVQTVLAAFTILTLLLSIGSEFTIHIGEYVGLVLFATAGMMVLASTQNLLVIFASLELLSLCLYILTAFNKRSRQSAEAALKYFLFGGMAAAFLLFGISLLYGLSGSIELPAVAASLQWNPPAPLLLIAIVMIVTGFGFKVAAAPFHLWAPDAYQGAPTPSAALIASSSKIASFFVFAVVLAFGISATGDTPHAPGWTPLIEAVAAISMLLGNLAAIVQKSVRRLLAYSAIGHAGYMLLGVLMNNAVGMRALLYYVITYALATIGAFGILAGLEKEGLDQLHDFAGLSRRAPLLSFCMLVFLLSLAGIPPLAGFFGKFYIFSSAFAARSSLLWLVVLAIAMSAVSLYYYLRVLKQIYVRDAATTSPPLHTPYLAKSTIGLIALLVAVLGLCPNLLLGWIDAALTAMPH
jgi:NADH-quinone oxidoreductase subunit N